MCAGDKGTVASCHKKNIKLSSSADRPHTQRAHKNIQTKQVILTLRACHCITYNFFRCIPHLLFRLLFLLIKCDKGKHRSERCMTRRQDLSRLFFSSSFFCALSNLMWCLLWHVLLTLLTWATKNFLNGEAIIIIMESPTCNFYVTCKSDDKHHY